MQKVKPFIDIREVLPYLATFYGEKFVITIDSNLLIDDNNGLVDDLVLLISCGMRFIVIPDETALFAKYQRHPHNGQIIINRDAWHDISRTLAYHHFKFSAAFTRSLRKRGNRAMALSCGNYVRAKPRGIFNGIDLGRNGEVRGVDINLIQKDLIQNQVVLVSSIAPSSTGILYWLSAEELAEHLAIAVAARKWIAISHNNTTRFFPQELLTSLAKEQGRKLSKDEQKIGVLPPSEITTSDLSKGIKENKITSPFLNSAISAINDGVGRVNVIAYNGSEFRNNLFQELFTHQGSGTVISANGLEEIRLANLEDLSGIMTIIKPLEEDGTLLARSREQLEEILRFITVVTHDGLIVGCAALLPIADDKTSAEFACFAVLAEHQKRGIGIKLLKAVCDSAKKQKIKNIYLLTSRTHEWFSENGFKIIPATKLPTLRQKTYDQKRCSKVMVKKI